MLFHLVDILISLALPVAAFVLTRTGALPPAYWPLYWLGCALGLSWELGYHFTGPHYSDNPSYVTHLVYPFLPVLQPLQHTLWDGALLVAGLLWVRALTPAPHLAAFDWREVLVMIGWGQAQSLLVETLACTTGAWSYRPGRWNPRLFTCGQGDFTLAPQLVWVAAPVVFYLLALWAT